ncbi:anti-sigma factor [soil metagenome]
MADAPITPPDTPEEREALAAELALGVLTGADRAQALRQMLADADFTPMVDAWNGRLEPLYADYVPVQPPEGLWAGIAASIDGEERDTSTLTRLRIWRSGAMLAGAVAASLALVLLVRSPYAPVPATPSAPVQVAVAQLVGAPDGPLIIARYDPASARLNLRTTGMKPGGAGGMMPELWVIPADGKPRSLGMIAPSGASGMTIAMPQRPFMAEGMTLAVTMEHPESAPHAAPSSAPVAAGKIGFI